MEKITADLYSWATRASHFRQKPCRCSERRPSPPGTEHVHIPSICTTGCSKGSGLLAMLSFKQIPKDDETLLMETVSSVVLTDLQFHQLNSAYWGFTKLLIEYGRHCKSQLKRWTQPMLLTSVFPVTVDFIRHWANPCWHPIGMPFSSIPGPDRDCWIWRVKKRYEWETQPSVWQCFNLSLYILWWLDSASKTRVSNHFKYSKTWNSPVREILLLTSNLRSKKTATTTHTAERYLQDNCFHVKVQQKWTYLRPVEQTFSRSTADSA